MHDILLIIVVGLFNIACFIVGVKAGRGDEMEAPSPIKIYNEHREKIEADKETEKINTILTNIERYDGTGAGQEDV